ncbi:MAG: hypothetical protein Q9181_002046 [Wetmoreana brouardii]
MAPMGVAGDDEKARRPIEGLEAVRPPLPSKHSLDGEKRMETDAHMVTVVGAGARCRKGDEDTGREKEKKRKKGKTGSKVLLCE